jgi:RNA polymerase sigma-70 factor (ECF subfamily)
LKRSRQVEAGAGVTAGLDDLGRFPGIVKETSGTETLGTQIRPSSSLYFTRHFIKKPAFPKGRESLFVQSVVNTVSSFAVLRMFPPHVAWAQWNTSAPRPMAKPTDRDLVDRARQGDQDAFGELVRRHQPRIYRLAAHMLRDAAEAEDVTQETFVRAYQALQRFDGRSEPYTWFYRIGVNLSLNRIRARKSSRTSQSSDDPRLAVVLASARPATESDPSGDASRAELYRALCDAIDSLSDSLRTTIILVCIDGRSHEEASAILGAPEGTIAWRVHEARRKLKEFLESRGFDTEGDPS